MATLGGPGPDTLVGEDDENDTIFGRGGNDRLTGRGGNDKLFGEAGNDVLSGQDGSDFLVGGDGDDRLSGGDDADKLYGGLGTDALFGGTGSDLLAGQDGNDILFGDAGNDRLTGGIGDDQIFGGAGTDIAVVDVSTAGTDRVDLGLGNDFVQVAGAGEVRLTFTSAEVGNGSANDGTSVAPQDGGLAVRFQAEDGTGALTGATSRYDDEGISFVAVAGTTFDVRDLVSGAQRGNQFNIATLGTGGADVIAAGLASATLNVYVNAGLGNDTVVAQGGNDFLVGGGGDDGLAGGAGNDSFIGGGGTDTITGDLGDDIAILDVSTAGADQINLGAGADRVNVSGAAQVRLTVSSAQVGNGSPNDGSSTPPQDGGLAVRVQAEDGTGALTGPISRVDDELITFVAGTGTTLDVRDISTSPRGEQFAQVTLGSTDADVFVTPTSTQNLYVNGGLGADTITTGSGNDFLEGRGGDDVLTGGLGVDGFLGAGGDDSFYFATNDTGRLSAGTADTINNFDLTDTIYLQGNYTFVGALPPLPGQYSITNDPGGFLITYNNSGTLHDILVNGGNPTGEIAFY